MAMKSDISSLYNGKMSKFSGNNEKNIKARLIAGSNLPIVGKSVKYGAKWAHRHTKNSAEH